MSSLQHIMHDEDETERYCKDKLLTYLYNYATLIYMKKSTKSVNFRLTEETAKALKWLSDTSQPHVTMTAIVEFLIDREAQHKAYVLSKEKTK